MSQQPATTQPTSQTVELPTADGKPFKLHYFQQPAHHAGAEPLPAIIVIHDILGFSPDTQRIARRLLAGTPTMQVAAPDLYSGLGAKPLCVVKTIRALRREQGAPFDRLHAVRHWLAQRPEVNADRIGVIGFCLGGGFALLFAADAPLAVAAPFYGDVPADSERLRGICPVVAGYGGRDRIFAKQGQRLAKHLETLGVPHDYKEYADAGHSYMNQLSGAAKLARFTPMQAAHHESAAADSWRRVFEFFQQHL